MTGLSSWMLYYQLHSKVNKSVVLDCAIYDYYHDQKSKDSLWNGNDDLNDNGNNNNNGNNNDGNDIEYKST